MAYWYLYLVLAVELAMLVELRRRIKAINAAELCCAFILASQVVYLNGETLFVVDASWPTYSFETHPQRSVLLYFSMFAMLYLSSLGIRIKDRVDVRAALLRSLELALRVNVPALVGVLSLLLVHLVLIDHQALWFNSQYLYLRGSMSLGGNPKIGIPIQSLVALSGFGVAFYFVANLAKKRRAMAALWFLPLAWLVTFYFSDASRSSFVIVMETLFLLLMLVDIPKVVLLPPFMLMGYVTLAGALLGRGAGNFGIAAIPSLISRAFSGRANVAFLITNLFEGVFVTSDGLDFTADFAKRYKILSFSPFPSFIDKFNAILHTDQIQLSWYVPMGAFTEAVKFGPVYFLLLMGTFCFAFRFATKNHRQLGAMYLLVTIGTFVSFVVGGSYPVRNVYRQVLVWIVLAVIAKMRSNSQAKASLVRQQAGARPVVRPGPPRRPPAGFRGRAPIIRGGRADGLS